MSSLEDMRNKLRQEIEQEDVSKHVPEHPRFEVEDIDSRQNYVLELDEANNQLTCFDSSRGMMPRERVMFCFDKFPHVIDGYSQSSAKDCYEYLYRKSLKGRQNIWFLGYVDKDFQPIEPD